MYGHIISKFNIKVLTPQVWFISLILNIPSVKRHFPTKEKWIFLSKLRVLSQYIDVAL